MTRSPEPVHAFPRNVPTAGFARWDRSIGAFVCLAEAGGDGSGAGDASTEIAAPGDGALAGVSVGVKDVIDVAGLPTRNGSTACADATAAPSDAVVVARLRAAGARIVGKTVTTEFAFTDPTECRNPYATDRSPGGSSSGSGAAVGARMVDVALGTQTAGSLCRPAAYCGAVGFKPGNGTLPMVGVTPLSPSHDMVGIIARSVALAEAAFVAMLDPSAPASSVAPAAAPSLPNFSNGRPGVTATAAALSSDAPAPAKDPEPPHDARATNASPGAAPNVQTMRAGWMILDPDVPVEPHQRAALDDAVRRIGALLGEVATLTSLPDSDGIVADHRTVMLAEAARAHGALLSDTSRPLLRPRFREALVAGGATPPGVLGAAQDRLANARAAFWAEHAGIDVIVTPPVPSGPPLLGASTGFQTWLTVWTVMGGPLLCLPWGIDDHGLPVSVMLAGRPGDDLRLLQFGHDVAAMAPTMPPPPMPSEPAP